MILKPKAIDCETAQLLIMDYIDGTLSESDTLRLEAHLEKCDSCKEYLIEERRLMTLVGASAYSVPANLHSAVMAKVADTPQSSGKTSRVLHYRRWLGTVAAACAAVMILVVGRGYMKFDVESAPSEEADMAADNIRIEEHLADQMPVPQAAEESVETSEFDFAIANLFDSRSAVIICRKSDFNGIAPENAAGSFILDAAKYERYVITYNAMSAFCEYLELLEAGACEYRAAVPENSQFDVCEIYLLTDGED